MVFVIPDEHGDGPRLVGRAVQNPLDVGAGPRIDGGVAAIVAVVAERGCDERVGGQVVHVELRVGPHLDVAGVVIVVGAGAVRIGSEVVERRYVLGGVAAGRAAGARALDVAPRDAAGDPDLPEDVVVGGSAGGRWA